MLPGIGSTKQALIPGISVAVYGVMFFGSVTILIIFPVMALAFRFTSAARSFSARPRIGASRASDGASIECKNSVSNSASSASFVLLAVKEK